MIIAFACGFGAFVAVETWGTSLTKPFIPSPEWPDAIVSILPGGVSSFDIEHLRNLKGVKRIGELQPLQVNISPLEELKGFGGGGGRGGRGPMKQYRNALLLASAWLPDFKFSQGDRESAEKALAEGDNCVITEMMARARKLNVGDELVLDAGRGLIIPLKVVGVVDLNWHMVTSRALVRGMNRMPVNTDGPVFVSFDTLAACDARPQDFVKMTHVWLDYEPEFLAANGVFPAGRIVEREIVEALGGAWSEDSEGEIRGNTVRLHSRDEIADGTPCEGAYRRGAWGRGRRCRAWACAWRTAWLALHDRYSRGYGELGSSRDFCRADANHREGRILLDCLRPCRRHSRLPRHRPPLHPSLTAPCSALDGRCLLVLVAGLPDIVRSRSGQRCSPSINGRLARPCDRSAYTYTPSGRSPAQSASPKRVPHPC